MSKVSRRALARFAVDELLAGKSAQAVAKQLAATLIEDSRASEVELLSGDIAWELERRGELTIGRVTSATPLSQELARELASQLKKATNSKEVMLEQQIDKTVIGGVRIETSARVWDDTVAHKLTRIREAF
jgi:F-type H+-transporting ATPase subunit delta